MSNKYISFLRGNSFGSEDDDDEITQAELDAMSPEEREFFLNMKEITAANLKMAKEIAAVSDLTSKDKWGQWTGKTKRDFDPTKAFLSEAERLGFQRKRDRLKEQTGERVRDPKKSKRKNRRGKGKKSGPSKIQVAVGIGVGTLFLGTTSFLLGKMRKKSGSLSEKPIDFLSRKKELESQGRIPGRITSVRGPFAPSVQQVPFQGQAQIIDLGAQMTRRLEPITPDQVATMEADAMNTFPQLMNQLGSQQGKRKLSQIAQINADNTKALIMEAHLTGRKLDFDGKKYTVSALKVLLMGNPKAERNFMRNYGRVFTSAIKRFDG